MKQFNYIRRFETNNLKSRRYRNDGFRTLLESIHPDVKLTLEDWKEYSNTIDKTVLIGGASLQYYIKPRPTDVIDLIFLTVDDIPDNVYKFRKHRPSTFEHIKTNVEVETILPHHINTDISLFQTVFDKANIIDNIRVASPDSLIALKIGRNNSNNELPLQDSADIISLYKHCILGNIEIVLSDFGIEEKYITRFENLTRNVNINEKNHYELTAHDYFINDVKKYEFDITGTDYKLYIFENNWGGEPDFHFGKNFHKRIKLFDDFSFSISLSETYKKNGDLKILSSNTEYNSFYGFEDQEKILNKWLKENNNLELLRDKWRILNKKNFKIK